MRWANELYHSTNSSACLLLQPLSEATLLILLSVFLLYFSISSANGASSFRYEYSFVNIDGAFCDVIIETQDRKLYVASPTSVIVSPLLNDRDLDENIVTRWDIYSGKCEAITKIKPPFLSFLGVSPHNKWLLVMTITTQDLRKLSKPEGRFDNLSEFLKDIPVKHQLLATRDLSCVHEWHHDSAERAWGFDIHPEFVDDDTLIF